MRRFVVVVVAALAVGASVGVRSLPTAADVNGPRMHSIERDVERADGTIARARFEVLAATEREAEEAAVAALPSGSHLVSDEDSVRAQWRPWPWKWDAAELPVDVAYNPEGAPAAVGPSAVLAGLQQWSNVPDSSFRFRYAGVTNNTASILTLGPDGENVVSWASLPCDHGCVLGITSKESAHEVDMVLNSNPAAAEQLGVGTTVDWRTVILHEFGHMAGLEHSCPAPFGPCTEAEADAVMYFQYRGILRKLAADDTAGMAALYPGQPAPTPVPGGTPPPSPTPEQALVVVLEAGWNLVLLPPGEVATSINPLACIEAVYSFENGEWRAWIRGVAPGLQDLTTIEASRAYWVRAGRACAHSFGS